ncbi:unnamed protein product, partial [Urochloa humidicola]
RYRVPTDGVHPLLPSLRTRPVPARRQSSARPANGSRTLRRATHKPDPRATRPSHCAEDSYAACEPCPAALEVRALPRAGPLRRRSFSRGARLPRRAMVRRARQRRLPQPRSTPQSLKCRIRALSLSASPARRPQGGHPLPAGPPLLHLRPRSRGSCARPSLRGAAAGAALRAQVRLTHVGQRTPISLPSPIIWNWHLVCAAAALPNLQFSVSIRNSSLSQATDHHYHLVQSLAPRPPQSAAIPTSPSSRSGLARPA